MLCKRIIPCLDVKNGRVVKGINFEGLRDAGDPAELASLYSASGADELCFLDISASVEGRETLLEVVRQTAQRVFIPMTVGGGISRLEGIGDILRAGADKVSLNSGAIRNPDLVNAGAEHFGSQCVVIAIDVKRSQATSSGWEVFAKGGRQPTGLDALAWAQEVVSRGAGEILLTSMDADGTKQGYDLAITDLVASTVSVPVVASGGAGASEHICQLFHQTRAQAALLASLLHYGEVTIAELKAQLRTDKVPVRVID